MVGDLNDIIICRSVQLYGTLTTVAHISAARVCKSVGKIKEGDVLKAEARYDPVLRPLIIHGETPDPVMGSTGVYIGAD